VGECRKQKRENNDKNASHFLKHRIWWDGINTSIHLIDPVDDLVSVLYTFFFVIFTCIKMTGHNAYCNRCYIFGLCLIRVGEKHEITVRVE
jgi:hypothetical protein